MRQNDAMCSRTIELTAPNEQREDAVPSSGTNESLVLDVSSLFIRSPHCTSVHLAAETLKTSNFRKGWAAKSEEGPPRLSSG